MVRLKKVMKVSTVSVPERSLEEYEEFSGLKFSIRGVQQYTLDKNYPPNPGIDTFETKEDG